jgi:hypothetical protein
VRAVQARAGRHRVRGGRRPHVDRFGGIPGSLGTLPSPRTGQHPTRGCSAVGSAPPWHGGGQGFESPQLHESKNARTPVPVGSVVSAGSGPRGRCMASLGSTNSRVASVNRPEFPGDPGYLRDVRDRGHGLSLPIGVLKLKRWQVPDGGVQPLVVVPGDPAGDPLFDDAVVGPGGSAIIDGFGLEPGRWWIRIGRRRWCRWSRPYRARGVQRARTWRRFFLTVYACRISTPGSPAWTREFHNRVNAAGSSRSYAVSSRRRPAHSGSRMRLRRPGRHWWRAGAPRSPCRSPGGPGGTGRRR